MDIYGKKAIVFGGTSGIGLSATQMLSDKGAHVVALSRNPEKLQNLPKNVTTKKNECFRQRCFRTVFSRNRRV